MLDDRLRQHGGAVGRRGQLVRRQLLREPPHLVRRQQPVQEHLLQDPVLLHLRRAVVLVQSAQGPTPLRPRGREHGADDGRRERAQPLLLRQHGGQADGAVDLAGVEEAAARVQDARLRQGEQQLELGVLDLVQQVLGPVQVGLGAGRVVFLEVEAHDADPDLDLGVVGDGPLRRFELDALEDSGRGRVVFLLFVCVRQQFADHGVLFFEGDDAGLEGLERVLADGDFHFGLGEG